MRRKIAKRKRKELLKMGATIIHEGWIKEPGWKRKDIGYELDFKINHPQMLGLFSCCLCEYDELDSYKLALELCNEEIQIAKDPALHKYSCCTYEVIT